MPLPRWFRRLVLAPAVVLLALLVVTTLPVSLLLAAAASPLVPGRLRPLRLLWMAAVYLAVDAVLLVALAGLWLAAGFGVYLRRPAFQRLHYALTGFMLRVLYGQARWALRLRMRVSGTNPDAARPGRPLIVLCRHAGPGDSFLLTHALINWYAREPRIVLKATLQWDPAIDVLLNRLPSRFITAGPDMEAAIGSLAVGLDENDAFVIFPEGGNFTPERWQRGIDRLRRLGLTRMAARAQRMTHVLAPRPGGVLAALDAAPDADILLVAHTGLDHLLTIGDVWRELPMDKTLTMRWWLEPRAEVPVGREERIEWLYDRWARVDGWVAAHQP
jgi:1-acyl-sn-glycerol-3-phosphate acyltransferase